MAAFRAGVPELRALENGDFSADFHEIFTVLPHKYNYLRYLAVVFSEDTWRNYRKRVKDSKSSIF